MRSNGGRLAALGLLAVSAIGGAAAAQDDTGAARTDAPLRPKISFNRWQEDWSVLADPRLRTDFLDSLKYIPLSSRDPASYVSLGLNVPETRVNRADTSSPSWLNPGWSICASTSESPCRIGPSKSVFDGSTSPGLRPSSVT